MALGRDTYLAEQSEESPMPPVRFKSSRLSTANNGWRVVWESCPLGKLPPEQNAAAELLLSQGARVDTMLSPNTLGTYLHQAAKYNDFPRVRWLVEHGAQIDGYDDSLMTPWMRAASGEGLLGEPDGGRAKKEQVLQFLSGNGGSFAAEQGAAIEKLEEALSKMGGPRNREETPTRAFLHVWQAREDATSNENEVE